MMNKYNHFTDKVAIGAHMFGIGFLTNSVYQRASGNIPDHDIMYPLIILGCMIIMLVLGISHRSIGANESE